MKFMSVNLNYDFLESAKKMPPLSHSEKNKKFDIQNSAAAKWIINQPEVIQKVFDIAKRKGIIVYDPKTETWQGVDYDGD